jgi:hypothetical protein
MNTIAQRLQQPFESDSYKTEEFKSFARSFKKVIKSELESAGATLAKFSVGHFDLSGFYQIGDRVAYFSLGDVRFPGIGITPRLMFRTAEHTKDFSGGNNNWAVIEPGIGLKMAKLIS